MAGAGKQRTQDELKNKAMLVVRNITQQEVTNVIFPNGITVGANGANFKNGFRVYGNAQISGVVNAQGFKVNGTDISISGGAPFLSTELTEENFIYGSNNPNESGTQTHGPIVPESINVKIVQSNQATTLSESDISIVDSSAALLITSSIVTTEASTGNSITSFSITPRSGSDVTTFPITINVSNDGLNSVKRIKKITTPILVNFEPLLDANTISNSRNTLTAGDLWMFGQGVLTSNTNIVGFNAGSQGPIINFNKKVSDSNAQLPTAFSSGSACPETMFYRGPSGVRTIVRQVTGEITFVPASFNSGAEVNLLLALYQITNASGYKSFNLIKQWPTQTFDQNNTTTLVTLGAASALASESMDPTMLGSSDGLAFGLYITAVQGSLSAASVQISGNFYVEYQVGTV